MHIVSRSLGHDPSYSIHTPTIRLVSQGHFEQYTQTAEELAFVSRNNLSIPISPTQEPSGEGYNEGNYLLGLLRTLPLYLTLQRPSLELMEVFCCSGIGSYNQQHAIPFNIAVCQT
jgi:hypothetical protein